MGTLNYGGEEKNKKYEWNFKKLCIIATIIWIGNCVVKVRTIKSGF